MLTKLCEAAVKNGMIYSYQEGLRFLEVMTKTGVYFVRYYMDDGKAFVLADQNGEMIEGAQSNGVMLDIGACIGRYSIPMAMKSQKVYAFEPEPNNFKELQEMTSNWPNIECINKAVMNYNGTADLFLKKNRGLEHTISTGMAARISAIDAVTVDTITIDDFVQANNIQNITGIKIDVEGAEKEVLDGALETLIRQNPLIALETHDDVDCEWIFRFLKTLGYNILVNENIQTQIEPNFQYLIRKP